MPYSDPNYPPPPLQDPDAQVASYTKLLKTIPYPGIIRTVMEGVEAGNYQYNHVSKTWALVGSGGGGGGGATTADQLTETASRVFVTPAQKTQIGTNTTALAGKVDSNDSRLSDARTPTAHTHAYSSLTGLPTLAPDLTSQVSANTTAITGKVDKVNGKGLSTLDVTQAILDGKADLVGGKVPASQSQEVVLSSTQFSGVGSVGDPVVIKQSLLDSKRDAGNIPASEITQTSSLQFVSAAEKAIYGAGSGGASYGEYDFLKNVLGSPLKAISLTCKVSEVSAATSLVSGQQRMFPFHITSSDTITGVAFFLSVTGVYTPSNTNGVALYTYSSGSFTKVAESTNTGALWSGTAQAYLQVPFSSTYAITAGEYYVGLLYSSSAQTTAPSLGGATALINSAIGGALSTNSKLLPTFSAQNSFSTPLTMSAATAGSTRTFCALY